MMREEASHLLEPKDGRPLPLVWLEGAVTGVDLLLLPGRKQPAQPPGADDFGEVGLEG
jgi:hypothetical protein